MNITVTDFTLDQMWPVAYRAVVAHLSSDSGSARAACGLAGKPDAAVATMAAYPGYTPGIAVMGTVVLKDTSDGIMMTGTLGGLETSTMGGIHIHTGVSCDDANNVGGHYYPGMASDPWTSTMWYSDSMGSSNVKFTVPMFSLTGMNPVANRAVVVHDSSGNRIACGVLMSTVGEVVELGPYPGNTDNTNMTGTLVVTQSMAGVSIMGTVTHVEASCTNCGLHIHTGTVSRTPCLKLSVQFSPHSICNKPSPPSKTLRLSFDVFFSNQYRLHLRRRKRRWRPLLRHVWFRSLGIDIVHLECKRNCLCSSERYRWLHDDFSIWHADCVSYRCVAQL